MKPCRGHFRTSEDFQRRIPTDPAQPPKERYAAAPHYLFRQTAAPLVFIALPLPFFVLLSFSNMSGGAKASPDHQSMQAGTGVQRGPQ